MLQCERLRRYDNVLTKDKNERVKDVWIVNKRVCKTYKEIKLPWKEVSDKDLRSLHRESKKNIPAIISRSLVKNCPILIIFGRHIPEKIWLEAVI